MFFSIDHLIRRDGRFALVWKVATKTSSKKGLDRRTLLSVEIAEICDAIMKRIPAGGTIHDEHRSKFSLYLLGQLVYGVVVILERQVAYLELDAKTAMESCNRLYINMDEPIVMQPAADRSIPRKRQKAKKINGPVTNLGSIRFDLQELQRNLNIDSFDDLDGVGMAMRNQITLADPVSEWRAPTMFQEDDLLPPNELERMEMSNFANASTVNRAGSGSKSELTLEDLLTVSQLTENRKSKSVVFPDLRPPGAEFEDLNRPLLDSFDLPPPGPLGQFPDMSLPPQFNDTPIDLQMRTPQRPNDELTQLDEPRLNLTPERKRRAFEMLQLDPAVVATEETPRKKRKRALCVLDENETMITFASIKEMVADYSSLLRSIDAFLQKPTKLPNIDIMLKPTPLTFRIPDELKYLYKAGDYKKMTYEEAAEIDPSKQIERGPKDKLWQYESSTNETKDNTERQLDLPPLDDELNMPGIAFLDKTPERFKEKANEGLGMQIDLQQPLNFDLTDPMANTLLPPNSDIMDNNFELGRRSRLSEMEAARRSNTLGPHHSRLDNRTGSVLLDAEREFGFSGFKDYSRINDITITSMTGANAAATHIRDAVRSASGEAVSFAELFPPSSVSRKNAARAFSALLGMMKKLEVEASQEAPYDDIYISLATTDSADSALDTTLSVEN